MPLCEGRMGVCMSDTELSKRKAKIGIYLFNAEFLVANYIYVEGYCNYSCWEELYFRAFLMSEQELLQKNKKINKPI